MGNWLGQFWAGFRGDFFDLPDGTQVGQIVARVLVAALVGGAVGFERGRKGKAAGMRTHMLVALAAAFFIVAAQQAGLSNEEVSRIVQGVAAGVGFLGAGAIVKHSDAGNVEGLTTAASLYFTTAVGIAAGMGREATAILGTALALVVLAVLPTAEEWTPAKRPGPPTADGDSVAGSETSA